MRRLFVKGGAQRAALTPAQAVKLRFDGWRELRDVLEAPAPAPESESAPVEPGDGTEDPGTAPDESAAPTETPVTEPEAPVAE